MYQGPYQHQHAPTHSNYPFYILVCNRQSNMLCELLKTLRSCGLRLQHRPVRISAPDLTFLRCAQHPALAPCCSPLAIPLCWLSHLLADVFEWSSPASEICQLGASLLRSASQPARPHHRTAPATCRPTSSMPAPPRNFFVQQDMVSRTCSQGQLQGLHCSASMHSFQAAACALTGDFTRPPSPADRPRHDRQQLAVFLRSSSRPCASFGPTSFRHSELATVTICGICLGAPPVQTVPGLLPDFAS